MAENLIINGRNKQEMYETLLPQLQSLTAGETDIVANMANVAAALKQTFDFFWVVRIRDRRSSCRWSEREKLSLSWISIATT